MNAVRERTRSLWMDTEVCPDAGPLAGLSDESFANLIDLKGVEVTRRFYASQAASIDRTEQILHLEAIECGVRRLDGHLFPALGRDLSELHLGRHVHWNSLERCWDCPCHGSHFGIDGAVLNGPALYPLEEVELGDKQREAAE